MISPLVLAGWLLIIATFGEALLYGLPGLWQLRRQFSRALLVLIAIATGLLISDGFNPLAIVLAVLGFFRLFNLLRISQNRLNLLYLHKVTVRTFLHLLSWQAIVALFWTQAHVLDIKPDQIVALLVGAQLALSLLALFVVIINISLAKPKLPAKFLTDNELPTLTVAVPARNETTELNDCLTSIIANNYPKLEILVYDDCSQGKTADIIRSFAHQGVRFVKGEEPESGWLAKNQAYNKLADESTGDYLIFCGADVVFEPDSFKKLINIAISKQEKMVCVLPLRIGTSILGSFIQPMRYWWELALPRQIMRQPPSLSTCWLIERSALQTMGGLEAVKRIIRPERFFARELHKTDEYAFLLSANSLGVKSLKLPVAQLDTALRTRYPQLHKRPEAVLGLSVIELLFLLGPFLVLLGLIVQPTINMSFVMVSVINCLLLITCHLLIIKTANPRQIWQGIVNFPLAVLAEVVISLESMWKYEFSEVIWKGRNICNPVMQVNQHLPKV